jgi:hypothetical protein
MTTRLNIQPVQPVQPVRRVQQVAYKYNFKALACPLFVFKSIKLEIENATGLKFSYPPHITVFDFESNMDIPEHVLLGTFREMFSQIAEVTVSGASVFGRKPGGRRYGGLNVEFANQTKLRNDFVRAVVKLLGFSDYQKIVVDGVRKLKFTNGSNYIIFADYHYPGQPFDAHITISEITGREELVELLQAPLESTNFYPTIIGLELSKQ